MAVQPQTPYIEHIANGTTTGFNLGFDCDDQDHLIVKVDDVEPSVGSWSLTGSAVVFGAAPTSGKKITIQRNTPFERKRDYQSYDNSFRPLAVNNDFDWIWKKLQELGVASRLTDTDIENLNIYVNSINDETRSRFLEDISSLKTNVNTMLDEAIANGAVSSKAILTIDTISDLDDVIKWDGRIIYIKDIGNMKYKINSDTWIYAGSNSASIFNRNGRNQENKNLDSASFKDYLLANELANLSTTDLSAKLISVASDTSISKLRLTKGIYLINAPVVFNRNFSWDFDTDAYLKFGKNGSIRFEGSATLIGKPTTNILNSSKKFGLVNTLKPHDLICIYNPADYSFSPYRAYYRAGEFAKVFGATATEVSLFGRTYDDYIATDVDIYKINPITIAFNRFNVLADNTGLANPVTFSFCENLNLQNYANIGSLNAGLSLDRCFNVSVPEAVATNNSALVGLNYGIAVGNSQNIRITGGNNNALRHCVSFGGGGGICSVPCREIVIKDAILKSGSTTGVGAGDFHGNIANSRYVNCTIDHATLGGITNDVIDCIINDRGIDGAALILSELGGGDWNIVNCTLVSNVDIDSSRGVLDITFGEDLRRDLNLNITDLKIKGKSASGYYPIKFTVGAAVSMTKKVTCIIDGLNCTLPNHGSFVHASTSNPAHANVIPNFTLIMRNISSTKKGVYYAHPIPTITSPLSRIELPTQRGSQLIAVPAGNTTGQASGEVITFDYFYPTMPVLTHSVGTDGVWQTDVTSNLKPVNSIASINTPTTARFALMSSAPLPEKTYRVSYEVGN